MSTQGEKTGVSEVLDSAPSLGVVLARSYWLRAAPILAAVVPLLPLHGGRRGLACEAEPAGSDAVLRKACRRMADMKENTVEVEWRGRRVGAAGAPV